MMIEVTMDEALGKRLVGFAESFTCGQAVLVFDDDTYTVLEAHRDRDDEIAIQTVRGLELNDFGDDRLVSVGVCSQSELDEFRRKRDEQREKMLERRDREIYEALKKKFGGM